MTQTDIQDNNANKIKAQDKINIIRAKYIASAVKKAQYPEERLKERQASIKPLVEEFLKAFSRSAMESFKRSLSNPLLLAYC